MRSRCQRRRRDRRHRCSADAVATRARRLAARKQPTFQPPSAILPLTAPQYTPGRRSRVVSAAIVGLVRLIWSSLPDGVYAHGAPDRAARRARRVRALRCRGARGRNARGACAARRRGRRRRARGFFCGSAAGRIFIPPLRARGVARAGVCRRRHRLALDACRRRHRCPAAAARRRHRRLATCAASPRALSRSACWRWLARRRRATSSRSRSFPLAYSVASRFMGPAVLQQEAARLALVTIHC